MDGSIASGASERLASELTVPRLTDATVSARGSRGRERWNVLRRMLLTADLIAGTAAGTLAAGVAGLSLEHGLLFATAVALSWPLTGFVFGLYTGGGLGTWASGVSEVPRMLVAALALSWPAYALAEALGAGRPALGGIASALGIALLSGTSRAACRAIVHSIAPLRQRTVIVGSGQVAGQLARKIKTHNEFGLLPIGIVDDDPHHVGTPDLPHLGRIDDLGKILQLRSVDRVIVAFSRASHEELLKSIRACRDARVSVDVVPRLFEFLDGARALDDIGGLPLLSIDVPNLSTASRAAKRVLDVAISTLALVLLAPVLVVLAIAIKLDSRGPVFFRQIRAGQRGRTFRVFKFRSMYEDADERKRELFAVNDATDGVMFKIREDPRITRVGKFLRRFSLDELPQLINVLRGEMSLVGPRPLILDESNALEGWHVRRLDLRPGLTGPWQISGRSDVPFDEMVRFDYQYVSGWSLARDIEILLATVPAVLSGRGAY
ncbi:MAG: sugar transferase [Thermoleophilaceae bacterium]|nr:sugar transferase [Thermoleophilaceae bacterium]